MTIFFGTSGNVFAIAVCFVPIYFRFCFYFDHNSFLFQIELVRGRFSILFLTRGDIPFGHFAPGGNISVFQAVFLKTPTFGLY